MSITVRLWSKADLESLQHNRWHATIFMNGHTFSKEEIEYYPYNLRKEYIAEWRPERSGESTEHARIYATDDTMLLRFIDAEYTRRPNYLAENITRYRVIIG
mgnify:FL=1